MNRLVGATVVALAAAALLAGSSSTSGFSYAQLHPIQKRLLSGVVASEMSHAGDVKPQQPKNYFPRGSDTCPVVLGSNVKVNQNCLNVSDPDLQGRGQGQNEPFIAADPNEPNHIVAASNDYRHGDTNCDVSYSLDKGRTWNDVALPQSFTRGEAISGADREYWQAGGDPMVAWDSRGNAYLSCLLFARGYSNDFSSGIYVYRSTQNDGASWNFPGRPVSETSGLGQAVFEDKPGLAVDSNATSPFRDRVYVTYTELSATFSTYIWLTYSTDYGEHFAPRRLVSIETPLCANTFGLGTEEGSCNANSYSQPFVGPDGTLYVVFSNYNTAQKTPQDNRNQILLVKSTDGGNTFTGPTKVADYYDLPDCPTYQDGKGFPSCVPEKGATSNSYFRAANYPSGAVDPTNPARVVVTFGSYINVHSNETNGCVPDGTTPYGTPLYTGVKVPGACNNDILLSVSNDAGVTFTGTTVDPRALTSTTQEPGQATSDQWFQWIAFTKTGKLATSYYDRQYGTDETTGFSDVSLSGSGDLTRFVVQRVTSSSMPPPTQFEGGFWGDYAGLTAIDNAYPVWSDTRNPSLFPCPGGGPPSVCTASAENAAVANDQDMYTAALPVPAK